MNIILFAHRDVGYECLNHLIKIDKKPVGVIIPYQRNEVVFKSIPKLAKKNNISYFLYSKNKCEEKLNDYIKSKKPDFGFSCYYPFILKQTTISLFSNKLFNLHGGILPDYKGALTSMWNIINNEKYSGSTMHIISKKIDQGNIIEIKKCQIKKNDTSFSLYKKISKLTVDLFKKYVRKIINKNRIYSRKQKLNGKYYSRILPNNGKINWSLEAKDISRYCRAFYFPGFKSAETIIKRKKIYIDKVLITRIRSGNKPGQINKIKGLNIYISTSDYDIIINKKNVSYLPLVNIGDIFK